MRARDFIQTIMAWGNFIQTKLFRVTAAAVVVTQLQSAYNQQGGLARELQWLRVLQWRLAALFVFWESLRRQSRESKKWGPLEPACNAPQDTRCTPALFCAVG